jgi:hypothetical protein
MRSATKLVQSSMATFSPEFGSRSIEKKRSLPHNAKYVWRHHVKRYCLSILRDKLSAYEKSNQSADDVRELQQKDTSALNSASWMGTFARNNAGTVLGSKSDRDRGWARLAIHTWTYLGSDRCELACVYWRRCSAAHACDS